MSDLAAFLQHLYGDQAGYVEVFSEIRPEPGGKLDDRTRHSRWFAWPQDAAALERHIVQEADELRREVYLTVRAYSPPAKGERPKRSAKDPMPVRVLFADGDGARVPADLPAPTAILESSPGKHHYLWALSRPILPWEAEGLSKRLAYAIGADPSGADLAQLVRVPGTRNRKYAGGPTVPLAHLAAGDVITPEALNAALPLLPEKPKRQPAITVNAAGGALPPVRLGPSALEVWRGEHPVLKDDGSIDRSKSLWKIGCLLWRAGATVQTIAAALAERDASLGYGKATGRPDPDAYYTSGSRCKYLAIGAGSARLRWRKGAARCHPHRRSSYGSSPARSGQLWSGSARPAVSGLIGCGGRRRCWRWPRGSRWPRPPARRASAVAVP